MFIHGKDKDDYLTSLVMAPSTTDLKYKIWKAENSMVMSWLINSMTNKIVVDFMYYEISKEIQDAKRESYSNNENISQLFEVKDMIHNLQQRDLSVTNISNFESFWQQLDFFNDSKVGCYECSLKYRKVEKEKRIKKFFFLD